MAKIDIHEFDQQRAKLASGLSACAEQLRNTAQIVEDFAKMLEGIEGSSSHKDQDDDGTKKRKRVSKPKDPNAPKRPASSYILFQNEIRTELKKQNPNMTNPQLLALISEKWKNMTDEEKETYNQENLRLKQQYSEAKDAYDKRSPEEKQAADKAAADAAAAKKARPRAKKEAPAPVAVATPPSPAAEASSEEDESEADSDDEEDESLNVKSKSKPKPQESSESEDESSDSDAESEPAPKRKRAEDVQPKKSKKSKA